MDDVDEQRRGCESKVSLNAPASSVETDSAVGGLKGAGRANLRAGRTEVPLELVRLQRLMALSSGSEGVAIALVDGPVVTSHPDLASATMRDVVGNPTAALERPNSSAYAHGTFVAGMLVARRGSPAPAICPDCTLLLRPIFDGKGGRDAIPAASPEELARAIRECVDAGARVLNVSAAAAQPSTRAESQLHESLDFAAARGVVVVAAAGNQGTLGSSPITRHPWVIPVVAYDARGRPMRESNLGSSLGRRGVGAPGEAIESLGVAGAPVTLAGTSAAVPFVTGSVALLWSLSPAASAAEVRHAVTHGQSHGRTTVAPPLLDAWGAHELLTGGLRNGR